jgi:hypothetical protein
MGFGVSLILIAVSAILGFAVNLQANGLDINTVGYIVLSVGIVGALFSMAFWSSWAGPGYFTRRRRISVATGPAVERRTVVEEEVV